MEMTPRHDVRDREVERGRQWEPEMEERWWEIG